MRISPDLIVPSQGFLKPDTVKFIFQCLEGGVLDQLPPMPIVRQDRSGAFVAVDGHNLIAVRQYRREDVEVHVAYSAADGLPFNGEASVQRNKDLEEKFELVIRESGRLSTEGIATFWDLIRRYPELFP